MDHSESVMARHAELEHEKLHHSQQHASMENMKEKHAVKVHASHVEDIKDAALCIEDKLRHVKEHKQEIDRESERRRREMFEIEKRGEDEADKRREEMLKHVVEKQKLFQ